MSTLPSRIVSTENEFGLEVHPFDLPDLSSHYPKGIYGYNSFLSNGARFYIDLNSTLEYAAPECLGAVEATHAEIAGEAVAIATLTNMIKRNVLDRFTMRKRNIDDGHNSWGYHENYCIERKIFESTELRVMMMAHLATRSIFTGAGLWEPSRRNPARITPAQKARRIFELEGYDSTHLKTLFNTRDEPHADSKKWARLHVITGDANISPWATWNKLGSTAVVLRLLEQGFDNSNKIELADPLDALHVVANDANMSERFYTEEGRKVNAKDVQEMLVERSERMAEKIELPDEERTTISEWRKAVDDIKADKTNLEYRADWITREMFLRKAKDSKQLSIDDVGKYNHLWELMAARSKTDKEQELRVGTGISFFRPRMTFPDYDEEVMETYIQTPPGATRARLRTELMSSHNNIAKPVKRIDWEYLLSEEFEYFMNDPHDFEGKTVKKLLVDNF